MIVIQQAATYLDMRSALCQNDKDRFFALEHKFLFDLRRGDDGMVDVVRFNAFHWALRHWLHDMLQAHSSRITGPTGHKIIDIVFCFLTFLEKG